MRFLTDHFKQATVWVALALLLTGALMPILLGNMTVTAEGSRSAKGILTKVPEPRSKNLRGIDWKPGTDQAFIVGAGAVYHYNATTKALVQLDGTESTDHYYESIAWRPQGDFGIIVGATPATTKAKGLISKIWLEGTLWRISAISTSISVRLTDIDWSPDGTYAVIVGGARHGEAEAIGAIMLRLSGSSLQTTEIYSDPGPSGLCAVAYNPAFELFYATGLDGKMITYDGMSYAIKTDNALKNADLFSLTWRDNGGRGIMGGWFGVTLKHYIITTDGTYNRIIHEDAKYINNADWAPKSDYTLLVGQSGSIWEYSPMDGVVGVDNPLDSKYYYGVDFSDDGKTALIVGGDGSILRYDVSYPAQENFAPYPIISSPRDADEFDYGTLIKFSSNGTHDDDLDPIEYTWSSSLDGPLSTQAFFSKTLTTGRHALTLAVEDPSSHKAQTTFNITIRPPTDVPSIDAGPNKVAYVGVDAVLDAKIVKSDYDIKTYEWDCQGTGVFRVTPEVTTECRYGSVGQYNATLRVTDIRLAVAIDKVRVTVFPKVTSADELVNVTTPGPLRSGDRLILWLNGSHSKSIKLYLVNPKNQDIPIGSNYLADNDTYYVDQPIPKAFKQGKYSVKWKYVDNDNMETQYYLSKDRMTVKKTADGGTIDWLRIGAAIVVVIIIVIIIFVIVMYMLKRTVSTVDAAVLFYRDGRVLSSFMPVKKANGDNSAKPPAAQQPQQPQAQTYPPVQQQSQVPEAQPAQYGAPYPAQYPVQPAAQPFYQEQVVTSAPAPAPVQVHAQPLANAAPTHPNIIHVQSFIQGQIDGIRQGTIPKIPDRAKMDHRTIFIEQGQHTILAVSASGPEIPTLRKKMKNSLQEIEILYGNQLRNWDGLTTDMPKLQSIIEKNVTIED